jgi:hypothetical protein
MSERCGAENDRASPKVVLFVVGCVFRRPSAFDTLHFESQQLFRRAPFAAKTSYSLSTVLCSDTSKSPFFHLACYVFAPAQAGRTQLSPTNVPFS